MRKEVIYRKKGIGRAVERIFKDLSNAGKVEMGKLGTRGVVNMIRRDEING